MGMVIFVPENTPKISENLKEWYFRTFGGFRQNMLFLARNFDVCALRTHFLLRDFGQKTRAFADREGTSSFSLTSKTKLCKHKKSRLVNIYCVKFFFPNQLSESYLLKVFEIFFCERAIQHLICVLANEEEISWSFSTYVDLTHDSTLYIKIRCKML